jgi:periplasmic copper chaperone A
MIKICMLITIGVLLLSACGAEKGIEVHEAWIRPAAKGSNGAVYFLIHNHSSQADELIGVSAEIAAAAELHESKMSGDIMQMNKLESIPLEANTEIEFAPGGYHVMLVGLKSDLKQGDEIGIVLHFRNYEDIQVMVPVRESSGTEDHSSEDH